LRTRTNGFRDFQSVFIVDLEATRGDVLVCTLSAPPLMKSAVQRFGRKERFPEFRNAGVNLPQMLCYANVPGDIDRPFQPQAAVVGLDRDAVELRIVELAHRSAQIGPPFLKHDQRAGEDSLGLRRVPRIEADFSSRLPTAASKSSGTRLRSQ
jgi:hypothetical protein